MQGFQTTGTDQPERPLIPCFSDVDILTHRAFGQNTWVVLEIHVEAKVTYDIISYGDSKLGLFGVDEAALSPAPLYQHSTSNKAGMGDQVILLLYIGTTVLLLGLMVWAYYTA